jgi:hypothetical protein
MISCSVIQKIMAGFDFTYKVGFAVRLRFIHQGVWKELWSSTSMTLQPAKKEQSKTICMES